ncbi:MAG: 2-oxo acid dehydrogenase subunit E2 [Solirubrobacterales bacterium]
MPLQRHGGEGRGDRPGGVPESKRRLPRRALGALFAGQRRRRRRRPGALVVPTVFDADRKGLAQIAAETRALAAKVRAGTITPPELSGAHLHRLQPGDVWDRSVRRGDQHPQAAILAVRAIAERPALRGGEIVPAALMKVTLACDHRILYGAEGAEFLARVRALLEEPLSLAL